MDAATVPIWTGLCRGESQTAAVARTVAAATRRGDIIALVGELGAGKTCFVRALAEGLGIDPRQIASPTFVLMHEYAGPGDQPALVHIDAYRLHSEDDMESIGWEYGGGEWTGHGVVVIEWADRLEQRIGDDYLLIHFAHDSPHTRYLAVTPYGCWIDRWSDSKFEVDWDEPESHAPRSI